MAVKDLVSSIMPVNAGVIGLNYVMRLNRDTIVKALSATSEKLKSEGVTGEVCIFGGAAMVLAFDARESTRDVDAVFKPSGIVRKMAAEVATELDLSPTWLNDGVKGYTSAEQDYVEGNMPQFSNLRVIRPSASYLLAMKCLAARVEGYDTAGDKNDVLFLIKELSLGSTEDVLRIVEKYYPANRLHVKTRFFVEEIIQELQSQ